MYCLYFIGLVFTRVIGILTPALYVRHHPPFDIYVSNPFHSIQTHGEANICRRYLHLGWYFELIHSSVSLHVPPTIIAASPTTSAKSSMPTLPSTRQPIRHTVLSSSLQPLQFLTDYRSPRSPQHLPMHSCSSGSRFGPRRGDR